MLTISLFSLLNPIVYSAAIYFGSKYYNYDIDGFLLQRSYDFMFIVSHLQIAIKNMEFYKNFVSKLKSIFKPSYDSIICIKNNLVKKISLLSLFFENLPDDNDYDMFIFKHENEFDNRIDNVLFYSAPNPELLQYRHCNYTFIQVILKISFNDAQLEYKINLRDDTNNFYIVNNTLNSVFLGYFLKLKFGVDYDMLSVPYTLTIMDHEVKQITLTENQELKFLENHYIILDANVDKSDESSDED